MSTLSQSLKTTSEAHICHHHTGLETKTAQGNVAVRGRRWNPGLCTTFCLLSSSHGWNDRSWESCRPQQLWSQTCCRRYQASEAKGGVSSSPMLVSISPLRSRSYILSKLIGQPGQFPYVLWWKWNAIPSLPVLCSLSSFKSTLCLLDMLWWPCQWAHVSLSSCLSFTAMKQSKAVLKPFPN